MIYQEIDLNQMVWLLLRLVNKCIEGMKPETMEELDLLYEMKLTRDFLAQRHPYCDNVNQFRNIMALQRRLKGKLDE